VKTPDEALALVKKYVSEAKDPQETVFIWGWDVVAMGGRHLDKTILDQVSATQPIVVWDASEHFLYANTAEMKKAGIKDDGLAACWSKKRRMSHLDTCGELKTTSKLIGIRRSRSRSWQT
jgi:predicted amidohydrolase YtcJ